MSEINVLIKKLKESILNLIKINYNVKQITLGSQLVLNNIDTQNKQINLDLKQIYDPENRFKKSNKPTSLTRYDLLEQKITLMKDVPDIKSSLKIHNIDLQVADIQEEIEKIIKDNDIKKKEADISLKIATDVKDKIPKLNYQRLITLLKQPLDKQKINDAVDKISFIETKIPIIIPKKILTKIKEYIIKNIENEEITTLMNDLNINKSIEKLITKNKSIIYLYDSQNPILSGGNYESYYKTNEKYIVSVYYILYKCYNKLLKDKLIPLLNENITICYSLNDIITNVDLFYKALKNKNKINILKNNYFQVFIVYHFLLSILNKFNKSDLKNEKPNNIYIKFNVDDNEPNNLELIKLIILFNKSITLIN